MRIKNTAIITALLLLQALATWAQPTEDKYAFLRKSGDKEYGALRYRYAIPYYMAYLQKNATSTEVQSLLGDCYYKMHRYDSALRIYGAIPAKSIAVQEKLAELYAWNKDYGAAKKTYQQLIAESKSAGRKKHYQQRLNGFENVSSFYKDSLDWSLHYLSINTAAQEFSPLLFGEGLVFASNRKNGDLQPAAYGWDGRGFEDVFWVKNRGDLFDINPQSIKKEVERNLTLTIDKTPATSNDNNTLAQKIVLSKTGPAANNIPLFIGLPKGRGHSGPISVSDNGNTIYFTRNRPDKTKGVYLLEICLVKKTALGWGLPKVLSFNEKGSSSYHPAINEAGTVLYFASDREGGMGGADIYKVEKTSDSTWSAAENMGSRVNTQGDEVFPTLNGNDLFFSSNGWPGLGGLDLFKTKQLPKANPSNLGYPVNSSADDFGYASKADGKEGYFSSSRYGSDDLFGYKYEQYTRELIGTIMGAGTGKIQPGIQLKMYTLDESGNKVLAGSTQSDAQGHYKFTIRPNEKYVVTIDGTDEFKADESGAIVTAGNPINRGIWVVNAKQPVITQTDTPPVPIATNWFDSLKNTSKFSFTIYHPFDKSTYRLGDEKIVKEVIALLQDHPAYRLQIVSATDCKGSQEYNESLSERRARYVVSRLPKALQTRTSMRWVSKNELKEPCEQDNGYDEAAQEINRYTYLLISDGSAARANQ